MPLERYGILGRRDAQTQTFPLSARVRLRRAIEFGGSSAVN